LSFEPLFLLEVLVVSFIAGFGWTVGCWLAGRLGL
jgi:hypothetical protein